MFYSNSWPFYLMDLYIQKVVGAGIRNYGRSAQWALSMTGTYSRLFNLDPNALTTELSRYLSLYLAITLSDTVFLCGDILR